ncbi:MAG: FecR domain-containing protein, partial [Betaproteobacteria bacterium]
MSRSGGQADGNAEPPKVTPDIAAEAAVWIARLHGPDRSPTMEWECRQWQSRSAAHRLAFERCTEVWEAVPGVRLADAYATASAREAQSEVDARVPVGRRGWLLAMMVGVAGIAAGVAVHLQRQPDEVSTGVGEQRLVVLEDGTRMTLNTATQVRLAFERSRRVVEVQAGEALFEVAKDAGRPFVVRAAGSEVQAVGTAFSVRLASGARPEDALAVTLIEGQVIVRPATANDGEGVAPPKVLQMRAGERVRLTRASPSGATTQQVDRPRIDQMVAWKRSEVVFDDVSLRDAVAEMNRYNRTPIVLSGASSLSTLRISGLYRTGDSAGFANAVAKLHALVVAERDGRLELASP